jgi:protein phosphatase
MIRVADHFEQTDTGRQRRGNEDSLFARSPLFAVADGMGGAQAGEVASRIAVEAFGRGLPDGGSPEEQLADAARAANERIHELSRSDRDRAGMGTTLTAAYVGEDEISLAHVGDSRAYLLRGDELRRLTRDHSLVQALIDQGKLTEEGAAEHPQRSIITRALGPEAQVEVDTYTIRGEHDDLLLLCSDGLTSMIGEDTIARVLRGTETLADAGRQLIDEANKAGGRDNITVVLFRLEEIDTGSGGGGDQPTGSTPAVSMPPRETPPAGPAAPRAAPKTATTGSGRIEARPPPPPQPRRRRRLPRAVKIAIVVLVIALPLLVGGWLASRAVYFVGTNKQGIVTIYRGLPYDLPAGVRLYERFYVSGVPAGEVPPARRARLFDHKLRSQRDAENLLNDLEQGKLAR